MQLPVSDPGPVRDDGSSFQCTYCDTELVHKLAQLLLPGLATACVDNTTGDPFKKPSSIAVDIRKEMVDYLTQRSETFIAETLVGPDGYQYQDREVSDDPSDILSDFLEDFAGSKRNILSHVSGWLLSDSREDKIDDFVQEMEMTRFWSLERTESIAEILLRNVDIKSKFHCPQKYDTVEKLEEHKGRCSFRPLSCANQGCRAKVSARCVEEHDSACPYKVLPCEQHCGQSLLRRDMDRHCITVCHMKLRNCPFYQVGCESAFPEHGLQEHCSKFLQSHLFYVLQLIHKKDATVEELKERAQLLEKSASHGELSRAVDARSLTSAVKELEAKIKRAEPEHN